MELNYSAKNRSSNLIVFAFILYLAHKLLPIVGYYMPSLVYLGVTVFIGLYLLVNANMKILLSDVKYYFMLFGISILNLLQYICVGNLSGGMIYLYGELQIVLYGCITIYCIRRMNYQSTKCFFVFIIISYIITIVSTGIGCINYPLAARYLATASTSDPLYQLYMRKNIGGFSFVYEIVLLIPLVIGAIKQKVVKLGWGIAVLLMIGMTVIASEYATALILFIFMLLFLLFKKPTTKKTVLILIVIGMVLLLGSNYIADFLEYVGGMMNSEVLNMRLIDLADSLRGTSTEVSTTGNRMELYKRSIDVFLSSSMLGTWNSSSAGGHSFIFDTLAVYGIVGGISLGAMYYAMYATCLRPYKKYDFYVYLFLVYIVAIFLSFINPKNNIFIFICILPLYAYLLKNNKQK